MSEYVISASNVAKGYAQGLILGWEFVPGTESWFSFGYLKTEENSEIEAICSADRSEIKIDLLFQDYMPNIPSVKIYLNLVYNTDCQEVLLLMQILICTKID
jgi:hypothetical protein